MYCRQARYRFVAIGIVVVIGQRYIVLYGFDMVSMVFSQNSYIEAYFPCSSRLHRSLVIINIAFLSKRSWRTTLSSGIQLLKMSTTRFIETSSAISNFSTA